MLPSERKSLESKLRLVYWIAQEDIALDKFQSLHDMCIRLGTPHLPALGEANEQYTSSTSVSGMLTAISEIICRVIKVAALSTLASVNMLCATGRVARGELHWHRTG